MIGLVYVSADLRLDLYYCIFIYWFHFSSHYIAQLCSKSVISERVEAGFKILSNQTL